VHAPAVQGGKLARSLRADGLTLNVEPTVYLDDTVGIKLALEVSILGNAVTTTTGTAAYQIGTRTASTVLQLKNGETDVLAGLIDNEERVSGSKVPGIGQLSILDRLFGASDGCQALGNEQRPSQRRCASPQFALPV
jgi:type II secretory pathway component GspD/PulD (secretin)